MSAATDLIELAVTNGQPTTTSLAVAERFGKLHKNVLQSIEGLECSEEFRRLNFQPTSRTVSGPNGAKRLEPMYAITKDGFMFLAMGFTGKEAAAWKERFIAAFNAMEAQLLEQARGQQLPQAGRPLFLSHAADIMVAADRTFRSAIRSGRAAGMGTAQAIWRANEITEQKTGVNLLNELDAHEHVAALDQDRRTPVEAVGASEVQDFWTELESGNLPGVACMPMLAVQAYRLYLRWCKSSGVVPLALPRMLNALRVTGLVRNRRKRYQCTQQGRVQGPASFIFPADQHRAPDHLAETVWLGRCVQQIDQTLKD